MTIRLPISFILSVLTTITLFWFLGMLISPVAIDTIPVLPGIDFTTHVPETEPIRIVRVPPPIPKPRPTEVSPVRIDGLKVVQPGIDPTNISPQGFDDRGLIVLRGDGGGLAVTSGSDRGPIPQIRIEPDYPQPLRDRGTEGWVTFRFTVAKDGRVKDIEIVDSQPARVWDSATIRAVSTWKYQPALKDGAPVEQVGVMATYRFELER